MGTPNESRSDLTKRISDYRAALDDLPSQKSEDAANKVIPVLLCRDAIAGSLVTESAMSSEEFTVLNELDARLKANSDKMLAVVGPSTFASWRETRQPAKNAWWWFLDERMARITQNATPLAMALTIIFVGAAITLWIDTTSRLLGSSSDRIKILGILVQALFALIAGTTFTKFGTRWVQGLLSRFGVKRRFSRIRSLLLAIAILLVTTALWFTIPGIAAEYYILDGISMRYGGLTLPAIEKFQRAIVLQPKHAGTYYYLGECFEDLREYDKAIEQYQRGISMEKEGYLLGYTNLAYLLLTYRKDHDAALSLLGRAQTDFPSETASSYEFHAYRGWAFSKAGLLETSEAEKELREALKLKEDGIVATCVLAQTLEQIKPGEAGTQWDRCFSLTMRPHNATETEWHELAASRLNRPSLLPSNSQTK